MSLEITPIAAYQDNYHWLITQTNNPQAYIVDPGDSTPVDQVLEAKGLNLAGILITHRHYDHVDGIEFLVNKYSTQDVTVPVYGPDSSEIPQITHKQYEGNSVLLFDTITAQVIETPGHTREHISYYIDNTPQHSSPILFCGDVLFGGGCGRIFKDGSVQKHYRSLSTLAKLPDNTLVYCAHEYTVSNLHFGLAVEPNNRDIQQRLAEETRKREAQQITLPTTIELEKRTNPFIRTGYADVVQAVENRWQEHYSTEKDTEEAVFIALRRWKDVF